MSWEAELNDHIRRVKQAAYERLEDEDGFVGSEAECNIAADVAREFGQFAEGHWASCDHMNEKLREATSSLTLHINDHMVRVLGSLAHWTDPVGDMVLGYLGAWNTAIVWDQTYILAMQKIAALQKEIIKATRSDVTMVAEAAVKALERRDAASVGDVFALAGAVAAVVGTIADPLPGDEALAAFALMERVRTAFEGGEDIAAALGEPGIGGADTFEILESTFSNLSRIRRAVEQREDVVIEALKKVHETFEENRQTFSPSPPEVDIWSSDQVRSLDPGQIQNAGELLPVVAEDNRAAARHVAAVEENEPHAFEGNLHDPPTVRWRARREELQNILDSTAAELDSISATLIDIANNYHGLQEEQTQTLDTIMAQLAEQ